MTHPYRDIPQEITEHRVWLDVYMQWLDKHAVREDVPFAWIHRTAAEAARMAVIAFRQLHYEAQMADERQSEHGDKGSEP